MSWWWEQAVLLSDTLSIYSCRPRWKCCMYEEWLIHEVQMKSHLLISISFHHKNLNKVAAGCREIASFSHHHIIITTSSLLAILSFPVKKFSWYKTCFLFKSTNMWKLSQQTLHLCTSVRSGVMSDAPVCPHDAPLPRFWLFSIVCLVWFFVVVACDTSLFSKPLSATHSQSPKWKWDR